MSFGVSGSAWPPRRLRWGGAAVCSLALHACGPSFEAIQEGDLRFAHCDRLDLDPHIAPSHRLHCWREWRRVYTYGQTRDRVEYAQRRIAEVVSGDTEPPFVLPSERRTALAPAGPPPSPIASEAREPAAAAAVAPPDPEAACRERCTLERAACLPGCETQPTGCKPCGSSLESCLSSCGSAQ